jgi:hypothetical protein
MELMGSAAIYDKIDLSIAWNSSQISVLNKHYENREGQEKIRIDTIFVPNTLWKT